MALSSKTGCGGIRYALVVFVVVDYATGLMSAAVEKKLSSEVGFKGIFKKVVIFCLVAVGHIVDTHIIGNGSVLRTAVIFFYLSNEGISILENIKQDMKFRRYLSKGTANVVAESTLLAMARNINKLHNKIQKGRTATHLFPIKSAKI